MSESQTPPPPGMPGDPASSYYPPQAPSRVSGMALTSMILGIIAIPLLCILGAGALPGLVALILGIVALVSISKNPGRFSGKGFAITGIILGGLSIVALPIMIAILLPSLGRAREMANRSVCGANLRGIVQSMNVYAADNADAFPIVSPTGRYGLAGSGTPNVTENMFLLVSGGRTMPQQFLCKSDPAGVTAGPSSGSDFASDMNYSYSFAYPWQISASPFIAGGKPGVGPWWRNEMDPGVALVADMAPLNGTGSPPATTTVPGRTGNSFNHQREGQNVAFGDGHVEFSRRADVGQASDNIYTSNNGAPNPAGVAFPGGAAPGIGFGGAAGAYDICMVPAADASAGYVRK